MKSELVRDIAIDAWEASVAALIAIAAFEVFEPGFAARFFNPSWLVCFALMAGAIALASAGREHAAAPRKIRWLLAPVILLTPLAAWRLGGGLAVHWRALTALVALAAAAALWNAFSEND